MKKLALLSVFLALPLQAEPLPIRGNVLPLLPLFYQEMQVIASSGSSGLTIGTTTITSGTDTRVLFDDAGVVGEDAGLVFNKTTNVLTAGEVISSGLTASRLVVSNGSKQLASNGALVTNTIPKAASSGASLSDSSITDDGVVTTVNTSFLVDPSESVYFQTDFIGTGGLVAFSSGSGAICNVGTPSTTVFGVSACSTGTTTGGSSAWMGEALATGAFTTGSFTFGQGAVSVATRIMIPTASDGTDTFVVYSGFFDSVYTDVASFRYTHSENSGNWTCVTRSNTTETTADSTITATPGTWYNLRIEVNAGATSAGFYIDGTLRCTITTNIPSGSARASSFTPLYIQKSAGTNARTAQIDYAYLRMFLTTPR